MHRSVFGVAGLLLQLAYGQVFPPPGGPFHTRWTSSELVDNARLDPFNASHARRLMISRFSPVPQPLCSQKTRVPYMSPAVAATGDAMVEEILAGPGWPRGVLEQLEVEVCSEWAETDVDFPILLFSPGFRATRLFCTGVAQQIASMGYEVVVLDHPYEADIVEFPDGTVIRGGSVVYDPTNATSVELALSHALEVRAADASFVLDSICVKGPQRVGHLGHSLGGATAAAAMLNDDRIGAGVNLDGSLFGPVAAAGVSRPFLLWGSSIHNSSNDPTWDSFFKATATQAWIKELNLKDSLHYSFFDAPIIGDVSGLRTNERLVEAFFGAVSGARVAELLREYLSDFFEFALGGEDQGLLRGPSAEYSDVLFLRESPAS